MHWLSQNFYVRGSLASATARAIMDVEHRRGHERKTLKVNFLYASFKVNVLVCQYY
jgi:hypothetical protein